jgi:hypothetical protein
LFKKFRRPLILAILILIGVAFSISRGQDSNFDLLNYHLYDAYSFLNGRLWHDLAPANTQTFHNPILDIPYFISLLVYPKSEIVSASLMGVYYGFGIFFIWIIASELFRKSRYPFSYSVLAAAVGATGAAGWSQLGGTFNEWQTALVCLASVATVLSWIDDTRPQFWRIALAGSLVGLAAGFKLTAMPFAAAVIIAASVSIQANIGRRLWVACTLALGTLLGFAISGGPWCWVMYSNFASPVFPYFNGLFHSPWAPSVSIFDQRFLPRSVVETFLYPFYWAFSRSTKVSELYVRDPRLAMALSAAYIFLAAKISAYVCRHKGSKCFITDFDDTIHRGWNFVLMFFLFSYFIWQYIFSIYRYTIPLEAIGGIIIVGVSAQAAKMGNSFRFADPIFAALIATSVILFTVVPEWGHVRFQSGAPRVFAPDLPSKSLVIVSGAGPLSFLIPFFRQDVRFVRGIYSVGEKNRYNNYIEDTIRKNEGPLFTLEYENIHSENDEKRLEQLGLSKFDSQCIPLKSSLVSVEMRICPLQRR